MPCTSPATPQQTASPPLFSGRDLFNLILPLIIQQILSVTVGIADSMMVSYAGEAAVSGVSLVNTLDTLLILVFTSLVLNCPKLCGQYKKPPVGSIFKN